MFKEIDLSRAVSPNTVAISFRYQLTRRADEVPLQAWLADNCQGKTPILLAGDSGQVTVRLRTSQKLYFSLGDPQLHLNLWLVDCRELGKQAC
jgi:hypothetical protein